MPTPERVSGTLEIRPGPLRQLAFVAGCLGFIAVGVLIVRSGHGWQIVIGVGSAAFFGWTLVVGILRSLQGRAIVLSPTGLRPTRGGEMPWEDIEEVATFKFNHNTMVGVRLRRRERFIASLTEAERRSLARTSTGLRVFGGLFAPGIATDSSLSTVEGQLDFSLRQYGYDWIFGTVLLDRSPKEFAALLQEYVASARASG